MVWLDDDDDIHIEDGKGLEQNLMVWEKQDNTDN